MVLASYLNLAAILFCIGLYGILMKRNAVMVLFSLELMLNAANLNLVAFARLGPSPDLSGEIFTLFSIAIAAAEAAVGLAIIIALYRQRGSIYADKFRSLRD